MIAPLHPIAYLPKQQFPDNENSIVVYASDEGRNWSSCEKYIAYCGSIRNNIAIAKNKDFFFLIKICYESTVYEKKNHRYGLIIQKISIKKSNSWQDSHVIEFNRTISGYYVLRDTYEHTRIRPGRDDQYYTDTDYSVYNENGEEVTNWNKEEVKIGFYLTDISKTLAECENLIYKVSTLQVVFKIPNKFKRNGVFDNGLLNLDAVGDNTTFYVLVENKKIIKQYEKESLDDITQNLRAQEIFFFNNVQFSSHIKLYDDNEFKDCKSILKHSVTIQHGRIFKGPLFKEKYVLTENQYNSLDFDKSNELNKDIVEILRKLRTYLLFQYKKQYISTRKELLCLAPEIYCYLYNDFFLLVKQIGNNYNTEIVYKIFNYNGKLASPHTYKNLCYGDPMTNEERSISARDRFCCNVLLAKKEMSDERYVLSINQVLFKEILLDDNMSVVSCGADNYVIHDDIRNLYLDFELAPIEVHYIPCKVECIIENYLYSLDHNYYVNDIYKNAANECYEVGNDIVCVCPPPHVTMLDNKLVYPLPKSFKTCLEEAEYRNRNRSNYIKDIEYIDSFYAENGIIQLYSFNCAPSGYLTEDFKIIYDFNKENIHL